MAKNPPGGFFLPSTVCYGSFALALMVLHSNFNSREFYTREVCLDFGHSFLGCGSYNLKLWQDLSPMSPLTYYTY